MHAASIEGDSLWTRQFPFPDYDKSWVTDIKVAPDGGYLFSTYHEANDNRVFPGLIKTDAMGNISGLGFEESVINEKVRVYPNPAAGFVVFELDQPSPGRIITITDITGRTVAEIPANSVKVVWEPAGAKPGVYFYRLREPSGTTGGKLLIAP